MKQKNVKNSNLYSVKFHHFHLDCSTFFLTSQEQLLATEQRTLVVIIPNAAKSLSLDDQTLSVSVTHSWVFLLEDNDGLPQALATLAGRLDSMVLSVQKNILTEHYKVSYLSIQIEIKQPLVEVNKSVL